MAAPVILVQMAAPYWLTDSSPSLCSVCTPAQD
uniref:Uncharacterized protein n=1 Tax=Anguilla anguilla TaxID=7936 RepID=A0A0E9RU84_ANGAN